MAPKSKKGAKDEDDRTDFLADDQDIPSQPGHLEVGLDLIYRALTEPYLTADQLTKFKAIFRDAPNPEYLQEARDRFSRLYPPTSVIDKKMREQIADAAIFLAQAAAAHRAGKTETTQAFMAQASAILPALTRRHINQKNKRAVQNECIQRFAERLLQMRPKRGWKSIDHAALASQPALDALLDEYKKTFGLLWKMDGYTLINQWLEQQQSDVYNAYLGVSSSRSAS